MGKRKTRGTMFVSVGVTFFFFLVFVSMPGMRGYMKIYICQLCLRMGYVVFEEEDRRR